MPKTNQNLKLHFIQALEQLFEPELATTPLLGNKITQPARWQVRQSHQLSTKEQEVKTWSEIAVGVKG